MNRIQRKLSILIILGMGLLAACGADPESGTTAADGATNAEGAEQTDDAPEEGSVEELALYDGDDRQERLMECAEEEGDLMFYTTSVLEGVVEPLVAAFEEEYPFINVEVFRAGSDDIAARVLEEYGAGRHDVDLLELEPGQLSELYNVGYVIPYYTPEAQYFADKAIGPDNAWITSRESHYGVGYNTNTLSESEIPKKVEDLLDERWHGKIALSPGTGVRWLGGYVEAGYEDVMRGLAEQDIEVHNISGRALVDLVVSGEVVLNPQANFAHVKVSQDQGAPVKWSPLEPTFVSTGALAMPSEPAHPCAALLYINYALSEEGQQIYVDRFYHVRREGLSEALGSIDYETVPEPMVDQGESYAELYNKWDTMFQELFTGTP